MILCGGVKCKQMQIINESQESTPDVLGRKTGRYVEAKKGTYVDDTFFGLQASIANLLFNEEDDFVDDRIEDTPQIITGERLFG